MSLLSFLRHPDPVPLDCRSNFRHLYGDVAWYGLLSASVLAFQAVYVARLGGSTLQVGLLTAGPAIVNLLVAMPFGRWLPRRPINKAVFWASLSHRLFYLLWIPLPWLLAPPAQVWALIGLIIAMSVPGTGLVIGFNALFAEAVPPSWRGYVAGVRNALLAVTSVVGSLVCGRILTAMPFPGGYQVVFAIGAVAALMSTLHHRFVRPLTDRDVPAQAMPLAGAAVCEADQAALPVLARPATLLSLLLHAGGSGLRTEILRSPFQKVLLVLFAFHITQYLAVPVAPVFMVEVLHLQDQQIGLATAAFWVFAFAGSMLLAGLSARRGHQWVTGMGAMLMAFYPGFMALSSGSGMAFVLIASAIGGLGYALMSGAFLNYILERAPRQDRPAYLAWYNIAFNAAILIGSLLGPFAAGHVGFVAALGLFAASRLAAGLFIIRRG